jgi:chromosome segregation ATPase
MNKTIGTLQEKITKLVHENTSMDQEVRNVQENLRLSANQNQKILQELNDYKSRIAANDQESTLLKQKINNLLKDNQNLDDEVRNAQENLRLSANQMNKLNAELNEYKNRITANNQENDLFKQKIQKLISENSSLNEEVRGAQENLRLSAATTAKLNNELNEYRSRFGQATQEADTYKQRIQKLVGENAALGD